MTTITISYNGKTDVYEDGIKITSSEEQFSNVSKKLKKINKKEKVKLAELENIIDKNVDIKNVLHSKFYLPNHDQDLIQGLVYRSCSYFEQSFLVKSKEFIPSENAVIIDIGANIGNHTLYWANEANAGKIYAFEPIPSTFEILKRNIELNNLENAVTIYQMGLSEEEGFADIKSYDPKNIGGTRLQNAGEDSDSQIKLMTLDSLNIEEDKVDLIKIDVEGMDYKVLAGAVKTIKKYKPAIMIESFPSDYEISKRILKALDYKLAYDLGSFEYMYVYER